MLYFIWPTKSARSNFHIFSFSVPNLAKVSSRSKRFEASSAVVTVCTSISSTVREVRLTSAPSSQRVAERSLKHAAARLRITSMGGSFFVFFFCLASSSSHHQSEEGGSESSSAHAASPPHKPLGARHRIGGTANALLSG